MSTFESNGKVFSESSSTVEAWEIWFSQNPLMRGESIGEVPLTWLSWLREAPAIILNRDGEATDTRFPDAYRAVSVCKLRRSAGQKGSALIEGAFAIILICLLALGAFDLH